MFDGVVSHSLARKLSLSVAGVALTLTAALGAFFFVSARDVLHEEIAAKLNGLHQNKAGQIVDHFRDEMARTSRGVNAPMMVEAIDKLFAHHRASGMGSTAPMDVSSPAYIALDRALRPNFVSRLATRGVTDVLLVCAAHGHVMFSLAHDSDLGANLRHGALRDSAIARAFERVVKSGKSTFTDLVPYAATGKLQIFLAVPVRRKTGELVAVEVTQFDEQILAELLKQEAGFGATGELLLVGEDMSLRSTPRLAKNATVLATKVDSAPVQASFTGEAGVGVATDYRGEPVLAAHGLVGLRANLGTDFDWALIAKQDAGEAFAPVNRIGGRFLLIAVVALILALLAGLALARSTSKSAVQLVGVADTIAGGDLSAVVGVRGHDEMAQLAEAIARMQVALRENAERLAAADWLKSGLVALSGQMRGEDSALSLAQKVISEVCTYLDAKVGVLYVTGEDDVEEGALTLLASYAHIERKHVANRFLPGEGLVGQAALERQQILLTNAPPDYIQVVSGLGEASPRHICVTPFLFEDHVRGVIELGTLHELKPLQLDYLAQAAEAIGVAFETSLSRARIASELARSQELSEELQVQQEELKVSNEELQQQTQALSLSEARLQVQQEELRVSNEELEEKNNLLERQKRAVEQARREITDKAEELAVASKYKSEFLANMSHELRTPLNSLLLLARSLVDNKTGNLTADQVESARVITGSGEDLLSLINEILDLAKIEAGRMDLALTDVPLADLGEAIDANFSHMAAERGLSLTVHIDDELPATVRTDARRLQQIFKNLVSNALKFTAEGGVVVRFQRPAVDATFFSAALTAANSLAISVRDTGIGIALEHQKLVFEAFQQVDAGIARRYGGTGLGLSISRELARILGGEIRLESAPGAGSTFIVTIPLSVEQGARVASSTRADAPTQAVTSQPQPAAATEPAMRSAVPDDRDGISAGDRVILVVEDDLEFAKILGKRCNDRGFKSLVATSGEAGLELARRFVPHAIVLDLRLPGVDGWHVLQALKGDIRLRHIPVHIVSSEDPSNLSFTRGAVGHLQKPVSGEDLEHVFATLEGALDRGVRRLLVVEDQDEMRRHIVELMQDDDVLVDEASTAAAAAEALIASRYDCVILDLGLGDMAGEELLDTLVDTDGIELPPVIVYTARDLTREQEARLREHTASIILKDVRSEERLLDEVSLFLHRVVSDMPPRQQRIIQDLHGSDTLLEGKKILIVDDDMRSSFALARLLTDHGMTALKAENGDKALKVLAAEPAVDLVLMDVMMPVMDGFEATRRIRAQTELAKLPIIVVTAKAMAGDRDRCLAAGANDYLTKPIDAERLLSLLRVWLYA